MTNLVGKLDQKLVKDYGITEVFYMDGELYTTSHYDLSFDLIQCIEDQLK